MFLMYVYKKKFQTRYSNFSFWHLFRLRSFPAQLSNSIHPFSSKPILIRQKNSDLIIKRGNLIVIGNPFFKTHGLFLHFYQPFSQQLAFYLTIHSFVNKKKKQLERWSVGFLDAIRYSKDFFVKKNVKILDFHNRFADFKTVQLKNRSLLSMSKK